MTKKQTKTKAKKDLYQEITDGIIAELEQGICRWVRPWDKQSQPFSLPCSGKTGKDYNGINIVMLMGASTFFNTQSWLTYKQAEELGGNVKKGEKSTPLVFFKQLEIEKDKGGSDPELVKIPMLRQYRVFNVEQCENIEADKIKGFIPERPEAPQNVASDLASAVGCEVLTGSTKAANADFFDRVIIPAFGDFKSADHFAATLFHELIHWTGSPLRLNRTKGNRDSIIKENYAFEELVAELGAAFLCAKFGIANEELQHADYIGSWLKLLKDDKRAIHKASAAAQKAVNYILELADSQAQKAA